MAFGRRPFSFADQSSTDHGWRRPMHFVTRVVTRVTNATRGTSASSATSAVAGFGARRSADAQIQMSKNRSSKRQTKPFRRT